MKVKLMDLVRGLENLNSLMKSNCLRLSATTGLALSKTKKLALEEKQNYEEIRNSKIHEYGQVFPEVKDEDGKVIQESQIKIIDGEKLKLFIEEINALNEMEVEIPLEQKINLKHLNFFEKDDCGNEKERFVEPNIFENLEFLFEG